MHFVSFLDLTKLVFEDNWVTVGQHDVWYEIV